MKIGIDLLWVRPGVCGGTESYIRNLMDGLAEYDEDNRYILFVAEDNADSFSEYKKYGNMTLHICPTVCASQIKRIFWENLHLDKTARQKGVDLMFIPVYSKPFTGRKGIPYISVIHDLQAMHYPQYFSAPRRMFQKIMWRHTCASSDRVITISEYCREDLAAHYPAVRGKCTVVYNPIETFDSNLPPSYIEEKYHVAKGQYFYCVSSMLPHKNLSTLLNAMSILKREGIAMPLVLSGVGGEKEQFAAAVEELGIQDMVIDTGFVANNERDCLYENCRLFLFPSVFEGFGMPPIEAMRRGRVTVMTRESCLEEVTQGKAVYVDKPLDSQDWAGKIRHALNVPEIKYDFPEYNLRQVVNQYLEVFHI